MASRINGEHADPTIVAIKAEKHRFTAFREGSGSTWIVCDHYLKEGRRRDKTSDRAIERAIVARADYIARVGDGAYYERT